MMDLYTEQGMTLEDIPWKEYPRPHMKRDSFIDLNGLWEFAVSETEEAPECYERRIRVPFAPETLLSGIHETFSDQSWLWYRREVELPLTDRKGHCLLHVGASSREAVLYVNGRYAEEHRGGYSSWTVDITEYLGKEEAVEILFGVRNDLADRSLPWGKQKRDRGGMWYTPNSGLWQTVWIEWVPRTYIRSLEAKAVLKEEGVGIVKISIDGLEEGMLILETEDGTRNCEIEDGEVRIRITDPHFWSPEDPYLYRYTVRAGNDRVESYFAFRTIDVREIDGIPRICLNGEPYFIHGLLDQGYWSDGGYTPASASCMIDEIRKLRELGFNTLRKHIKVEPELFYYICDKLGMLVVQDMVNNGGYSFLGDTLLPTLGFVKKDDSGRKVPQEVRDGFLQEMRSTVSQLRMHPSIVMWTIFNEGWGQFSGTELYEILHRMDPTRLIDTASGWFRGCRSDILSKHTYFRKLRMEEGRSEFPYMITEFGGHTWKVEGHSFNEKRAYGYGKHKTRESYVASVRSLYEEQVIPLIPMGLCGAIYTQVSDVEDEVNGIFTYDRAVQKILPEEFADISEQLKI